MKIAAVAPCLYPDTKRIHYLEESCRHQGVELFPMGIGITFGNWRNMTLQVMVPGCRDLLDKGYTHMLYMDGIDTFVVGSMEEIQWKYAEIGSPSILYSAEKRATRLAESFLRWDGGTTLTVVFASLRYRFGVIS